MNQPKKFQMGQPDKCWYDKKEDVYIPYSEMSKEQLQKCLHIAQKREIQLIQKQEVFSKLIEDIDEECAKRDIKVEDIPSDYYKNTRQLQASIKLEKSKSLDA